MKISLIEKSGQYKEKIYQDFKNYVVNRICENDWIINRKLHFSPAGYIFLSKIVNTYPDMLDRLEKECNQELIETVRIVNKYNSSFDMEMV